MGDSGDSILNKLFCYREFLGPVYRTKVVGEARTPTHPLCLNATDRLEPGVNLLKAGCIKDLLAQLILLFRGKFLEQGQEMFCSFSKSFAGQAEQHPAGTFLQTDYLAFLFQFFIGGYDSIFSQPTWPPGSISGTFS